MTTKMPASSSPAEEQLDGEGRQAYAAFTAYLHMPVEERSLSGLAKNLHKSKSLIERWSSKFNWVARVRNRDQNADSKLDPEEQASRQEIKPQATGNSPEAYIGINLSGLMNKKLPELEAYLMNMPIDRLLHHQNRLLPSLMRLQQQERDALVLLAASMGLAPVTGTSEGRDEDVAARSLDPCSCGELHSKAVEQWPCESTKAYAAFKDYRGTGQDRSIRSTGNKLNKHRSQLQTWAKRYEWRRRAEKYDQHQKRLAEGKDHDSQLTNLKTQVDAINTLMKKFELIVQVCSKRILEVNNLSMDDHWKLFMAIVPKIRTLQKGELDALAVPMSKADGSEPGILDLSLFVQNKRPKRRREGSQAKDASPTKTHAGK